MNSLLAQVELNLEKEECAVCIENLLINCEKYLIYKNEYDTDRTIREFYQKNVQLSEQEIVNLSCQTVKQSSSSNWFKARRLRISASSNVHNIKVLSKKPVEALVSDILNPSKIDSASTRYGLKIETHAKEKYQELANCIVKRVGVLVIKFQPWLCASLDGVVTDDGCISKIVEFKCPSSCEKKSIINIADNSSNVKYLQFIDNKLVLKKTDIYYTQVQVQMYVSGMSVCDFFVYSPVEDGSCLIEVHRDEDFFKTVILKSEKFYFEHYLPALYATLTTEDSDKENYNNNVDNIDNVDSNEEDVITLEKRSFTGSDFENILN